MREGIDIVDITLINIVGRFRVLWIGICIKVQLTEVFTEFGRAYLPNERCSCQALKSVPVCIKALPTAFYATKTV